MPTASPRCILVRCQQKSAVGRNNGCISLDWSHTSTQFSRSRSHNRYKWRINVNERSCRKQSTFRGLTERLMSNCPLNIPTFKSICRRLGLASDVISAIKVKAPRPICGKIVSWNKLLKLSCSPLFSQTDDIHRTCGNRPTRAPRALLAWTEVTQNQHFDYLVSGTICHHRVGWSVAFDHVCKFRYR